MADRVTSGHSTKRRGEAMERAEPESGTLPDDWCMHHFDHLSDELAQTLPATMTRMRALCPVAHSDAYDGVWVVSSYDEAVSAAQNWEALSSAHGLSATNSKTYVRNLPVEVDPPEQRVYKRLLSPHFTPAAVSRWEAPTRELVTRLIDGFIDDGACEFMDAIARPVPSRSFFEYVISAPAEDLDKVAYLAATSSIPQHPEARECGAALYQWIKDFVGKRRAQPRGDVVDAVIGAQVDGRPITEDEIIGSIQLIILGGLETTAGALGQMILRFCRQPEIAALLRGRPELIPEGIQELMRLDPSFVSIGRMAVRDTEIGGKSISAGERVLIHWASANRDSREFAHPDEFDLDRGQNRHLSFGVGPHRCLGSNLARMNMRIALEEVLRRMDDIKLADGAVIRYHAGLTRSPISVPITFAPVNSLRRQRLQSYCLNA
jgi:cytochrome P450